LLKSFRSHPFRQNQVLFIARMGWSIHHEPNSNRRPAAMRYAFMMRRRGRELDQCEA
jgi:hypothetical protein